MKGNLIRFVLYALFVFTIILQSLPANSSLAVQNASGEQIYLYENSYALIVGISDYQNGWSKLPGVYEDVSAVKAALERSQFIVETAIDLTKNQLVHTIEAFVAKYGQEANNRLLFYFAGHGHTMRLGYGGNMGYFVTKEAPDPRIDRAGFKRHALSMQSIEVFAKNIETKHALFIFDSCFAGSIFAEVNRSIPEIIQSKTAKPVRMFITAGSTDQQVPDVSIFRRQFVKALAGAGDTDYDGYITGVELGNYLESTVTNYSKGTQTPRFGKLRHPQLDKGDFVFAVNQSARERISRKSSKSGAKPSRKHIEIIFWNSIKDTEDPTYFASYLTQYPSGSFASIARLKISELGQKLTLQTKPSLQQGRVNFDGQYGGVDKKCRNGSLEWHIIVANNTISGRLLYNLASVNEVYSINNVDVDSDGNFEISNIAKDRRVWLKGKLGGRVLSLCGSIELSKDGFNIDKVSLAPLDRKQRIRSLSQPSFSNLTGRWSDQCHTLFGNAMKITKSQLEFWVASQKYDQWTMNNTDISEQNIDMHIGIVAPSVLSFQRVGQNTLRVVHHNLVIGKNNSVGYSASLPPKFFKSGTLLDRCEL